MTIETLTQLIGWITIINIIVLSISTLFIIALPDLATALHSRLFGLDRSELMKAYFQYLGQMKTILITFNIAPYIALKIIAAA